MAFIREPVLAIWQATKCLAAIHARTEAPDVSQIIAEAETILLGLMLALAWNSHTGWGFEGHARQLHAEIVVM